ncbi:putative efflux protein, MATE family [Selenomonas ruminantium]|uniref:Multidrug export protein MepA n=2 Tax=Selenomonas ruminantium TaxID=971 RepID=A0A1H0U033_SELRU|nr:putative efflux protein, MATE family [Selenomonas ruminantium]
MRKNTRNPLSYHHSMWSLLKFAAPSIGMMIVISLYTVTDGIFIGRYVGSDALAASNIVYPAFNLVLGLAIMLAAGGSALVAKTLGEGNRELASRRFTLITISGVVLSLILALTLWLFMEPLLAFLGASPALYDECVNYIVTLLPFFPAAAMMMIFNALFIADGRPIQGFAVSVVSGILNACLDYLFMAKMGLGIAGAALGTGLGETAAAIIGLHYFARRSRMIRFMKPTLEWRMLLQAMYNGSSELVTELSVGVTTYLFNIITFSWAGADGVAAISVILYAEMLLTSILVGFNNGIAPIFSYQYGAKNYRELLRLMRLALLSIGIFSLISFAGSRLLAEPLIQLFLPDGGSAYSITVNGFLLFGFSFLLSGFNIFTSGFFTAIADGRTSAIASFARNFAGIVIFLLLLPKLIGFSGVWLAVPAADLTAVLLSAFLLYEQRHSFLTLQQKAQRRQSLQRQRQLSC